MPASEDLRHGLLVKDLHLARQGDAGVHGLTLVGELEGYLAKVVYLIEDIVLWTSLVDSLQVLESSLNHLLVVVEAFLSQLDFDLHGRIAIQLVVRAS